MGKALRIRRTRLAEETQDRRDRQRVIELARQIQTREQFEAILADARPEARAQVAARLRPYLPFTLKNRLRRLAGLGVQ